MSLKITSFAHSWLRLTITFLNEAKTLSIAHMVMGNFCRGDKKKESQIENMGTDACVIVGFNNKVRLLSYLFPITFFPISNKLYYNI